MHQLSARGEQILTGIASRHGFDLKAVSSMLDALLKGNGAMAQFNHREFGGSGQWMRGGMTMISDMFNSSLKGRVEGLCSELSSLIAQHPDLIVEGSFQNQSQSRGFENAEQRDDHFFRQQTSENMDSAAAEGLFAPLSEGSSGHWWPVSLGSPNSTGSQNNSRYAYFSNSHRLAIEHFGKLTIYDTLDHRISGVSQQQSLGDTLQFSSQYGLVDVASLPIVTSAAQEAPAPDFEATNRPEDIFAIIEKLAALRDKGILTEAEFSAKKTELLSRI